MSHRRTLFFVPIAAVIFFCVAEQYSGCRNSESPMAPTPCGNRNRTSYGEGILSFALNALSRVDSGKYVPSDQFISDTSARQGAGGFVRDTVVALRPLRGAIVGFRHSLSNGTLYDTLVVFNVYSDSSSLTTGDYQFARGTAHPHGKYSLVTLLASDALHQYTIFSARDGLLTITLYDSCDQQLRGTFAGTLWDASDTTNQLHVSGGQFALTYVDHYFNY